MVTKSVIEPVINQPNCVIFNRLTTFKSLISVSNNLWESLVPPIASPIKFDNKLNLLLLHFLLLILINQLGNLITLQLYCYIELFFSDIIPKNKKINEHISNAPTVSCQKTKTVSSTSSRMKNIFAPLIHQDLQQNP